MVLRRRRNLHPLPPGRRAPSGQAPPWPSGQGGAEPEGRDSCENLLILNINRPILKLPIMVKPYNASFLTMVDYLKDSFDKTFISPPAPAPPWGSGEGGEI